MTDIKTPLLPNNYYHVFSHANGHENLFNSDNNYQFFMSRYAHYIDPIANTIAYCLMPNHFHFLIEIKDEKALNKANILFQTGRKVAKKNIKDLKETELPKFNSNVFSNFLSSYTQSFNKYEERNGSLFVPNFKRKEVCDESYLINLIAYIHNNPKHHGFVENIEDWEYSSYNSYLEISEKEKILNWFGGVDSFINFHQKDNEQSSKYEISD
jgi:putative transposase